MGEDGRHASDLVKTDATEDLMSLVGKTFGIWEVISYAGVNNKQSRVCNCRCLRCGRISQRTKYQILNCNRRKCGNCSPNFRFVVAGDTATGTLPSGDRFLIDTEDMDRVSNYYWYKKPDQNYVIADIKREGKLLKRLRLHRFLLGLDDETLVVDHVNRNPMDCRKSNMRIATQPQNCLNRSMRRDNKSGFIGVSKSRNLFDAALQLCKTTISLGSSKDAVECAQMYNIAAGILFKQFAGQLNNVPSPSVELVERVAERCRPYLKLADELTKPVKIEYGYGAYGKATQTCSHFLCTETGYEDSILWTKPLQPSSESSRA